MTPEKDLFNLIKSLDSNEKRYFKLHVLHSEGGNYEQLFDSIAAQKEYDEKSLRKKFEKQIGNFADTKKIVFQLVLRGLRLYQSKSSQEIRLYEMLQSIEILFNRGLFNECSKLLRKAKQEALISYNSSVQLSIYYWESRIIRKGGYANINRINSVLKEEKKLLEEYETTVRCKNIHDHFFSIYLKHVNLQPLEAKKKLRSVIDFGLLEKKSLPMLADVFSCFTLITYYRITNDHGKSYHYCIRLIKLLESIPRFSSELLAQYINANMNTLVTLLEMKRYNEFWQLIKKVRDIPVKNQSIAAYTYFSIFSFEYKMRHKTGEFGKAVQLTGETIDGLKKNKNKLNNDQYIYIYYAIAYSYFGNEQYSKCIEWLNKILNEKIVMRHDLLIAASVLHILAHIEKGNYETAIYISNSVCREIEKYKTGSFTAEKMFLDFLRNKLSKSSTNKQRQESYIELKNQLKKLPAKPFENTILDYIEIPLWIESKISGRSFAEVVRGKDSILK